MDPGDHELDPDVVRFIEERIDTVPHLEALLLIWESQFDRWTVEQTAARIYVSAAAAASILDDLVQRRLVQAEAGQDKTYYRFNNTEHENGEQLARVAAVYRRRTVQVASLIHSKTSTAVRDFARAFRWKKD